MRPRWNSGPRSLVLVRHGHSVGNQADADARETGAERLDLADRDADVELSSTGRAQSDALAGWLADRDGPDRPTVIVTSPYRRAAATAECSAERLGLELEFDERLRERDLGIFDGLTGAGIRARHPEEAERRKKLGKFYYQPPSGESWTDVVQRVRSLLQDLRVGHDDEDVWLFTHQAVIMAFRFVLEDLSEEDVLELDRTVRLSNASVTTYRRDGHFLVLDTFADTSAVDEVDVEPTAQAEQGGQGSHEHD